MDAELPSGKLEYGGASLGYLSFRQNVWTCCSLRVSCPELLPRGQMFGDPSCSQANGMRCELPVIHPPSYSGFSLPILPRRYASISVLPARLAQSAGVARQRMSCKSNRAPRWTRSRTTSSWPRPAAWCSGVVWEWPPTGLYRFGSSPASSNNRTIST